MRIYLYAHVKDIDGRTTHDSVVEVDGDADPLAYAIEFCSPIGYASGLVDVEVREVPGDDEHYKVIVTGNFRSLGEPLETHKVAEFYIDEHQIGW